LAAVVLFTSPATHAQQADQTPRFRAATSAVIVDVVVRDGEGRLVTNLTKDEFRITENGDPQMIDSFRVVGVPAAKERTGDASSSFERALGQPAGAPETHVVGLVFDRLSLEARLLAQRATLSYLHDAKRPGDRVGVFAIDLSLKTLQNFTDDARAVETAVNRATRRPSARIGVPGVFSPQVETSDTGRGNSPSSAPIPSGAIPSADVFDEMLSRLDKTYEKLERDHAGYATLNALLAIVHAMHQLPGRKTLVFFSEGLILPEAAQHHLESLVDTANRANVAIYTLDAAGLRVRSPLEETRERLEQRMSVPDALMRNPEAGLAILADETGGTAIRGTNDLRPGLQRIGDEIASHYLLGYAPSNQMLDGKFRRIGVSVAPAGLHVRARRGYVAVREDPTMPVLRFEAPAVALLDGATVPNAFPMRAGALAFPEPNRPGLTAVIVQFQQNVITFGDDKEKKRYAGDVCIVVRIKDRNDQIVRKLSQRYELSGPLNQLDAAKQSEILFYREPELAPGVYTLEAIVYDAVAQKGSARLATVEVEPVDASATRISSLMIVRRSERVPAAERNAANPLYFGEMLLYPNLGEPLRKAVDKELTLAAVIYPAAGAAPPAATLQLVQNGKLLAQAPIQLPAADAAGRLQYVGRLSTENLAPGAYELRLAVGAPAAQQIRSTLFRIE